VAATRGGGTSGSAREDQRPGAATCARVGARGGGRRWGPRGLTAEPGVASWQPRGRGPRPRAVSGRRVWPGERAGGDPGGPVISSRVSWRGESRRGRPGASTHRPRGGGRGMETGDKDEEEGKVLPEVWRGACDRGEEEKEGDTCRHAGDSHPRLSPAATPPTPRAPTDENTRIERGKTKCTFIKLKTWTPRGAGDGPSGPPGGAGEPYTGSWGCWVGSGTPGAGGPSPWVWDADRLFGGSS
jgi:hypothetical protein